MVEEVWKDHKVFQDCIFVIPSTRAGTFLRNYIAAKTKKACFAPEIYSIEAFIEKMSGLSCATPTDQLFALYQAYLDIKKGEKESFFEFCKWAGTLLADFDEIDRYLISHNKIFSYLSAITEMSHWYLQKERTALMKDYISFWDDLGTLYSKFVQYMLPQGKAHQGLIYRKAQENLPEYLKNAKHKHHVFLGFNALNNAESSIIQTLLKETEAQIYWDLDRHFLNEDYHDAGYFLRQHLEHWNYYEKHRVKGLSNNLPNSKRIEITGVPRNTPQMEYVGHVLQNLCSHSPEHLTRAAVILGNETLLNPLLHHLPTELNKVNITMGYPLKNTMLADLFEKLFELFLLQDARGWYYKMIFSFFSHPFIQHVLSSEEAEALKKLEERIHGRNLTYINKNSLINISDRLSFLFDKRSFTVPGFIELSIAIIEIVRTQLEGNTENTLEMEYLYGFYTLFQELKELSAKHGFITDIQTLQGLYQTLLIQQKVDFQGEPLEGLQVMGMLESRLLDFETVIITSVNEGILPSGKKGNSFIPYDLKKELGMPTYKEKDAVYTYHFYRLIQRAKHIYIIYNTEPDVLEGGEPSRFIKQLQTDPVFSSFITQKIAYPATQTEQGNPNKIHKGPELEHAIKNLARKGFSPTSLSNYILDPVTFYRRSILRIDESPSVDETIAATTFGTVIHKSLEELYSPFVGKQLHAKQLRSLLSTVPAVVLKHYSRYHPAESIEKGSNAIAFQVLVRSLKNFIEAEIEELKNHNITLLAIEQEISLELSIPGLDFPVLLKGSIDRVDEVNGVRRILDYKTGKVERSEMDVVDWGELIKEPRLSKVFQVLCYAFMYAQKNELYSLQAGVWSFRNLKQGFLAFGTKKEKTSRKRIEGVNESTLISFRDLLFALVREICDQQAPFEEKVH